MELLACTLGFAAVLFVLSLALMMIQNLLGGFFAGLALVLLIGAALAALSIRYHRLQDQLDRIERQLAALTQTAPEQPEHEKSE